jgi:hypothetical protein
MLTTMTHPRIALRRLGPPPTLLCLLVIVLCLSSCASQNPAEQISKFSQAATAVTSQTRNSYQAVQDEYLKAQTYRLIANYDTKGFNPALLKPFLPPEVLQVRIDVLQGLGAYAQGLASLASDDQITQFDSETKKLGQQLVSLDKEKPIEGTGVTASEMAAFATAVDAIGRMFIEYKREVALKKVISDHNDDIQKICQLFSTEIGGSTASNGVPPKGLRNQLWNEYTQVMTDDDLFIQKNKLRMTATEKFNAISQLASVVQEQAAADAMLIATSRALDQLAKTHSSLDEAFETENGGLAAMIAQLQADAKNISDFYNGLTSSQK